LPPPNFEANWMQLSAELRVAFDVISDRCIIMRQIDGWGGDPMRIRPDARTECWSRSAKILTILESIRSNILPQCVFTILWPNATALLQTSFTCRHATELQVWWLLVFPPCSFSHDWSDPRVLVQRIAAELSTHWSQSFCRGPQRETLGVLNMGSWTFWWMPTKAQQQISHL
jgi:hypothetical protein